MEIIGGLPDKVFGTIRIFGGKMKYFVIAEQIST
jgi:hypothetical protein